MADDDFFDRVYRTRDPEALAALYDDWAGKYDADLGDAGYRTPGRVAAALRSVLDPGDTGGPILDYGCGTGLSGVALEAAGFSGLDGCDPSEAMLEKARATGAYGTLWSFDVADPPDTGVLGRYAAIVAIGVVSVGAAPPDVLDHLWSGTAPGARLAFSFNAHTLDDPAYMTALETVRSGPYCVTEVEEDGAHITGLGSTARVYVLRRA